MSILSLLTDFGTQDGFVGVMKAVIWEICPTVQITDISHHIQPQNVKQAAITLARVAPYFEEGSVHVAVVDPGVGTKRKAIAAQIGTQFCVAPDNGLLTLLIQDAEEKHLPIKLVNLNVPEYWRKNYSQTFHGRDIFAPVGAHLAAGVPLNQLGSPIHNPILLDFPKATKNGSGWEAEITLIDHFGNLRTNLLAEKLTQNVSIHILGEEINGIVPAYGYRPAGELVAVADSGGFLEIAVVNGSAKKRLSAKLGDTVKIIARE
jgi:S-adenosylmethionine hydrolase